MNQDTQNPVGAETSELGPTRNPQTPGGENLGAGGNNLQTPTNLVTNSDNLSITSVGNSDGTKPATIQTSTQATQTQNAKKDPPYAIIGIGAVAIIAVFVLTWFMTRTKPE